MWLFTTIGFFSTVQDRDHKDRVCVRVRYPKDLDALRAIIPGLGPTTVSKMGSDYAARAFCTKEEWGTALTALSLGINYTNFKNAVFSRQGAKREGTYMRVWSVMKDAQWDERPRPSYSFSKTSTVTYNYGDAPRRLFDDVQETLRWGDDYEDPFFVDESPGDVGGARRPTFEQEEGDEVMDPWEAIDRDIDRRKRAHYGAAPTPPAPPAEAPTPKKPRPRGKKKRRAARRAGRKVS